MVYNKESFNKHINAIIPDRFNRVETYCMFQKEIHNHMEIIYYSHRDYFPHGVYIEGASAEIVFPEVESILNSLLDKYNIQQRYGNCTIHAALHNIEGIDYSKFNIEIHDDESFQIVAAEIKKIVKYGAMPFFEKYDTLEKVADLLADKTPEEIVPYIQGAILFPKTILILKIAKHKRFEEKLIEFREVLKQYTEEKEIYKQMLMLYDNLFADDLKRL
jgi:hypothetical protein